MAGTPDHKLYHEALLGRLAIGVLHHINNALGSIVLQADLAALPESAAPAALADRIRATAERAATLSHGCLALARSGGESAETAAEVLASVVRILEPFAMRREVLLQCHTDPGLLLPGSGAMRLLLAHLVEAAVLSSDRGGIVMVRGSGSGLAAHLTVACEGPRSGSIRDTQLFPGCAALAADLGGRLLVSDGQLQWIARSEEGV